MKRKKAGKRTTRYPCLFIDQKHCNAKLQVYVIRGYPHWWGFLLSLYQGFQVLFASYEVEMNTV